MSANTCCFTGHRNIRREDEIIIREKLRKQIIKELDYGVTTFLVGGAIGFDMLAAEVLLDLRDKEGKNFHLVSVLPYPEWRSKWAEEDKIREDRILVRSDEVIFSKVKNRRRSYLDRDRIMVDRSSACISWCTRETGGTAYTIRYAMKQGVRVKNLADWDVLKLMERMDRNG